jgi:hypothetical protein
MGEKTQGMSNPLKWRKVNFPAKIFHGTVSIYVLFWGAHTLATFPQSFLLSWVYVYAQFLDFYGPTAATIFVKSKRH